ncbi:hypothetical protein [Pseudoroseicyclus sp. CXY001]
MKLYILIAIVAFILLFSLGAWLGYRATKKAQTRSFTDPDDPADAP